MAVPRVDGYEIYRLLGGGPLSEVFSAHRFADNRPCVLKLPREEWAGHVDAVAALRREGAAARAVHSANVVRLLEANLAERPYFLVFEYLSGESLRDRLHREFRLDDRRAFWIARQVAEGLHAIHNAGYIHGDVKPENVQLTSGGPAVLIDLGFAHRPEEAEAFQRDGTIFGTANYLAPERAAIPPSTGFAADWYSFGVMLYEMLTGELPHQRRTLVDVLKHSLTGSSIVAARGWPERLTALMAGLLQSAPSERPTGPLVVHELVALEIAALSRRRAG